MRRDGPCRLIRLRNIMRPRINSVMPGSWRRKRRHCRRCFRSKHKGTEKLQADTKRHLARLREEKKKGARAADPEGKLDYGIWEKYSTVNLTACGRSGYW